MMLQLFVNGPLFFRNGPSALRVVVASRSRAGAGLPVRAAQPLRATTPPRIIDPPCGDRRRPARAGSSPPCTSHTRRLVFSRGTDAAEPHIRSPLMTAAPKFFMPEDIGAPRAGPIFVAASRSQDIIRSAPGNVY